MRSMSRPGKGNMNINVVSRVISTPPSKPKPQISEADRLRIAEEKKKIRRRTKIESRETITRTGGSLQHSEGVTKIFVSPQIYDFEAEVKFFADFTNWEEIPITTQMDNNFTYSVTWKVSPGVHFYLFKINGKIEINKHLPTGLAPNGQLMNKVDCP